MLSHHKKADPASQFLATSQAKLVQPPTLFNTTNHLLRSEFKKPPLPAVEEKSTTKNFRLQADKKTSKSESLTTFDHRTMHALANGKTSDEALTCARIGAGAQNLTQEIGSAALFTAASKLTENRSWLKPVTAGLAVIGNKQLEKVTPVVGDLAQEACHTSFEIIRQFEKKLMTSLTTSSTSTTSPKP